jgi:TolB protein
MLAWASYTSQYPDIYVSTLDGRPVTRPAQGTESIHNQSPAISPDGTKIAFASSRGGRAGYLDIWVVNRDGTNLRNLTADTADSSEGAPTWSPAGNQIAFTSDKPGSNQIYLMNADGTGRRRLTFEQQADRPTWSAKNFIAYTLRQPAGHDIAILRLTENTPIILTNGNGSNRQPSVSPNGRHVVFVTTRWGKEHLASIDLDGKNIKQLTTVGNNTYPNWSPSPGR